MKAKKEFRKLGKNMPNSERTPMKSKYPKRNFSITRYDNNPDSWYHAKVTDRYGNKYDNWFEFAHEANDWIYYVWDNEEWFNSANSQELLAKAIAECVKIDEERGKEPLLD